jgi:hypothetical protein
MLITVLYPGAYIVYLLITAIMGCVEKNNHVSSAGGKLLSLVMLSIQMSPAVFSMDHQDFKDCPRLV